VGREGIARFLRLGNRGKFDTRILRFRDAAELRATKTLRYSNRVLHGIDYSFTWTDASGRAVFRIAGTYKAVPGKLVSSDSYHFATAAEVAWSNYLLRQIWPQFLAGEMIFFCLGGGDWLRIDEHQMVVCLQGDSTHYDMEEISEVRTEQGWFEIRRKDWDGDSTSSVIFKVPYGNLSNAQLLLFLLDRHFGIHVK
jgi:hypothetical protein